MEDGGQNKRISTYSHHGLSHNGVQKRQTNGSEHTVEMGDDTTERERKQKTQHHVEETNSDQHHVEEANLKQHHVIHKKATPTQTKVTSKMMMNFGSKIELI